MSSDMKEAADTCLIVSGGPTDRKFAAEIRERRGSIPYVIAVDAGLAVCEDLGLVPDLAVGDFDTFGLERMEELRKKEGWATDVHKPEKDETDTDLAVRSALRAGFMHSPCARRYGWKTGPRALQHSPDEGGEGRRTFHGDL